MRGRTRGRGGEGREGRRGRGEGRKGEGRKGEERGGGPGRDKITVTGYLKLSLHSTFLR